MDDQGVRAQLGEIGVAERSDDRVKVGSNNSSSARLVMLPVVTTSNCRGELTSRWLSRKSRSW
jgi:hypothetical protein